MISTYGYVGGAVAESINGWIQLASILCMIRYMGYHRLCWHGWSRRALSECPGPPAASERPQRSVLNRKSVSHGACVGVQGTGRVTAKAGGLRGGQGGRS